MTQPPDDLERRPDGAGSDDPVAPENQPTIAWTSESTGDAAADAAPPPPPDAGPPDAPPPDAPPPDAPPPDAPPHDAPPPDAAAPPATSWEAPATTPTPASSWGAPATTPPLASPIISASPSVPSDATGVPPPAVPGPVVGWELPGPAADAPGREGYVIAGMGARLVAYFMDSLIVAIIPTILTLVVTDYGSIIQQAIDAQAEARPGQIAFVMEVTPELILVTLIGLALQFIYLVGFWTSDGRATPGMRGLRMQVVDAAAGGTLSLTAATKRFIALGAPLSLLILVPGLQTLAGLAQFAMSLFLFFTAITNDRRQGLHDRWANSLVIRSTTSGDGATLVGCVLLVLIVIGIAIIVSAAALAALGPQLEELMREMENTI